MPEWTKARWCWFDDCCACTIRGHVAAAPPTSVMNSRRFMARCSRPEPKQFFTKGPRGNSRGRPGPRARPRQVCSFFDDGSTATGEACPKGAKKRTHAPQLESLFNHLVGEGKERGRY